MKKEIKLTIELVPATCFFSNVRSMVSKDDWDKLRKESYKKARHRCEICGGKGDKWPVECHEVWSYHDDKKIQKLERLNALCPPCHAVKHIGLASIRGEKENAIKHMMTVNDISRPETIKLIDEAFLLWNERSKYEWDVDLTFLRDAGVSFWLDR